MSAALAPRHPTSYFIPGVRRFRDSASPECGIIASYLGLPSKKVNIDQSVFWARTTRSSLWQHQRRITNLLPVDIEGFHRYGYNSSG